MKNTRMKLEDQDRDSLIYELRRAEQLFDIPRCYEVAEMLCRRYHWRVVWDLGIKWLKLAEPPPKMMKITEVNKSGVMGIPIASSPDAEPDVIHFIDSRPYTYGHTFRAGDQVSVSEPGDVEYAGRAANMFRIAAPSLCTFVFGEGGAIPSPLQMYVNALRIKSPDGWFGWRGWKDAGWSTEQGWNGTQVHTLDDARVHSAGGTDSQVKPKDDFPGLCPTCPPLSVVPHGELEPAEPALESARGYVLDQLCSVMGIVRRHGETDVYLRYRATRWASMTDQQRFVEQNRQRRLGHREDAIETVMQELYIDDREHYRRGGRSFVGSVYSRLRDRLGSRRVQLPIPPRPFIAFEDDD